MRILISVFFILFLSLPIFADVQAACVRSWICDDRGHNCRVTQVCDSTIDLPSVGLAPLRPLPSVRLKPLPSVGLPPLGTRSCAWRQVNGQWLNVCK
jgi:hypothetical protein